MNTKLKLFSLLLIGASLIGCDTSDESPFAPNGGGGSSGLPISDKNFSLFVDPADPAVIDDDGGHGGVEVKLVVQAGDKFNVSVSGGTVYFITEWGILDNNSCELVNGSCFVTWRSDADFGFMPADLLTAITAYTSGEESYLDLNGSGNFDDADGNVYLRDIPEPYLDLDRSLGYSLPDQIIDIDNNGVHTIADLLFNGSGCTHSTLCNTTTTRIIIWDQIYLNMDQRTPPP